MGTVVITDGKYRSSIAAARMLGRGGYRVVAVQTRGDAHLEPPVFTSRYASEARWLDGSVNDADYPDRLYELLAGYDHPVLFCAGAATLNAVANQRERFAQVCDFLIAPPRTLDALNDKEKVHRRCQTLGIPVPAQYVGEPEEYPVIIKPHCGEKFGLKAKNRYAVARNFREYAAKWAAMAKYDPDYHDRLYALLAEYDRPILFCVGAATLHAVADQRERFAQVCDFLIAPPRTLDALNDKEKVHRRCQTLGIPVPAQYVGEPEEYPVIIKPRCGEKFGLRAKDRYAVARNFREYAAKWAAMAKYDPDPIVQQKVDGPGAGASLLLDRDSRLIAAVCHRRIREYPATGGPSTCCESFYDAKLIDQAYRLLASFRFVGMAMVEFKGPYVLEVNPRVWGSFPMTEQADSPFACRYAQGAAGEKVNYVLQDYKVGVRMRFTLNDGAAMLDYLRHGKPGPFFQGMADWFRAKEALSARDDPAPFRRYLRNTLLRR